MADTIFCQVEEDLAAFCPEDMRGFSVRLALAPDAARQDEEARTAIGEFLGTLRDVSFAVFRVDGQTATRLAVPTSVVRADPGTPEELAALQTSVAAWICNYSKVEGYLHPSLGEVGTPVTARQDQLGVHQVMLSTASRPAPLPQQVGLATALHVSLHALNHAGVDATRLLILPMGLFGFTAPDTFTLPSAPELGQEVDAPPNPAATVVCRSTIIKPLSEDPTSLLDANTGFFNPVDQSADQSADAHRFLQRLERRGATLFDGFTLAANIRWRTPGTEGDDPVLHTIRLSWQAVQCLTCALDTLLLALFMPGRSSRDGALLDVVIDELQKQLNDGGTTDKSKKQLNHDGTPEELQEQPSHDDTLDRLRKLTRAQLRQALRHGLREHPFLAEGADRTILIDSLREACGLPPLAATPLADSADWLDLLLDGYRMPTPDRWKNLADRYGSSLDEATQELDRLLGGLHDRVTSEAGLEASALRLLRHANVASGVQGKLCELAGVAALTKAVATLYDRTVGAFEAELRGGLDGAQLARQAVGSLLSDLAVLGCHAAVTEDSLKARLQGWAFWAGRLQETGSPADPVVTEMLDKLPRLHQAIGPLLESGGQGSAIRDTVERIQAASAAMQDAALAELSPPDTARFMPDTEPRALPIQVMVDTAADDNTTGANDFSAAFAGVALLLRKANGPWAHANLAQATFCDIAATTVLPIPTTVSDSRRQMFIEYRGLPFASRAYDRTLPASVTSGGADELLSFDHVLRDQDAPLPPLAYGTQYHVAAHVVGRSGVLPQRLQADPSRPWEPATTVGDENTVPFFQADYSRTMAVGATILREDAGSGAPRRFGAAIDDVRPLAADYARLGLASSVDGIGEFLDVFRNADGSGAIALPQVGEPTRTLSLEALRLWDGDPANPGATLSIEVITKASEDRAPVDPPNLSLRLRLGRFKERCRLSVSRLYDTHVRFELPDEDVNNVYREMDIDLVPVADACAWLRLRLTEADAKASLSLADPAGDQRGKAASSRPAPQRHLLCAVGDQWRTPFTKPADLMIESPRTSWANVQRWLDNPKLRALWLGGEGGLDQGQQNKLRLQLQTADVLRAIDARLPDLLERLPDPAVSYLEIDVQPLDGLRGEMDSLQASEGLAAMREQRLVPSLGAVVRHLVNQGNLSLDDESPFKLLHAIDAFYRTPLRVTAQSGIDTSAKRWLTEDAGLLNLHVPQGMVAWLRVRPLVLRSLFEPAQVPVMHKGLLQWAVGSSDNGLLVRFEGASLQVEAMLGPIAQEATKVDEPWRSTRQDWADRAGRAVKHLALDKSRHYDLIFGAQDATDRGAWRQVGWIDIETQRWRFTGRPLRSWFNPETHAKAHLAVGQASLEVRTDVGPVQAFMEDAFDNRSDSDSTVHRAALSPFPAATTLQRFSWEKPSATFFRHRLTVRSRYAGALASETDAQCAAWLKDKDPWRAVVSLAVEHEALTRAKLKATARLDGRSHFVRFTNLDKDLAPKDEYELAAQQARTTQLRDALGLAEVGLIREFELCRFTHGYTRMSTDPLIEKTDRQTVRMPVRLRLFPSLGNKRRPIYVVTQANEALYFQLDAAMLMMWLEAVGVSDLPDWKQGNDESLGAHVLQRAEPFGKFFSDLHPDRPKTYRYVYTLLHSYSHMVMKAVADLSGLDLGSLGEYLFPADLAFVVYRNGTTMDLGNLSALWRNFNNSFLDHISAPRAMQCGSGSLCETKGGACPDCIVVPETSCVASNRLLSRSVMRSGLAPREDADHQGQPIPGFLDVVQRGADARVGG